MLEPFILACMRFLFLLSLLAALPCAAQRPDPSLQQQLETLVTGFEGDVGVYVRHLATGEEAVIFADTLFPTASMIKVPILLTLFDTIEKGGLRWDSTLVYRDSLLYPGEDLLGAFADSSEIALSKAALLMITMSDNTASLWLQHLVGTGVRINEVLAEKGFTHTRVNSRTPGRGGDWERYGWGQTTPREMAELLVMIREGRAVSPGADEAMYRLLTRIYWDDEALSALPPYVQAASKQGAVNQSRSEVVLVNAPHGDYVFAVITKNQQDQSWGDDNAGFVLLRRVSALLWNHFEPGYPWSPPPGTRY